MLVYTVLRTDADAGYVERVTYPSRPIDTFTQAELMQGLIAYVHRGNGNSFIDIHYANKHHYCRLIAVYARARLPVY